MAFTWLTGGDDVAELIAKRNFARAAKVLRGHLAKDPANASVRQQLAEGDAAAAQRLKTGVYPLAARAADGREGTGAVPLPPAASRPAHRAPAAEAGAPQAGFWAMVRRLLGRG